MTKKVQLVRLGDVWGLPIPEKLADKYGFQDEVVVEELEEGLLIHAHRDAKLSWEETYRQMAAEKENWSDWLVLQDEEEL